MTKLLLNKHDSKKKLRSQVTVRISPQEFHQIYNQSNPHWLLPTNQLSSLRMPIEITGGVGHSFSCPDLSPQQIVKRKHARF